MLPCRIRIGIGLLCVLFSPVAQGAEEETLVDRLWAASDPTDVAAITKQLRELRAAGRGRFDDPLQDIQTPYDVEPTEKNAGAGVIHLHVQNKSKATRTIQLSVLLTDYWRNTVQEIVETISLQPNQKISKTLRIPVVAQRKRYRLRVRLKEPASGKATERLYYPLLDCLKGLRQQASLNGSWDYLAKDTPKEPQKGAPWAKVHVPHRIEKFAYVKDPKPWLWYRRTFVVPPSFKGKRVFIRVNAARFNPAVYINGKLAGEHHDGFTPCEFEVTELLRPGENELRIRTGDWTTIQVESEGKKRFIQPSGFPRRRGPGIWQDVSLVAKPAARVDDVFVRTSIRDGTLHATTRLRNDTGENLTLTCRRQVMDGEEAILASPSETVTLAPGETKTLTWKADASRLKPWWPHDPKLYRFQTTLRMQGKVCDESNVRFGVRECWVDGKVLRLNGKRLSLRRVSEMIRWGSQTPEAAAIFMRRCLSLGVNNLRYHITPAPVSFYDIADELGMLLIAEGAVYTDAPRYAVRNPQFWSNFARHLQALARLYRNNPSLVMYSPENELIYCWGGSKPYKTIFPKRLPEMASALQKVDNTRPLSFDGDGDATGAAETWNTHYPSDWANQRLLPNGGYVEVKDKPWILGEFLCISWLPPESFTETSGGRALRPAVAGGAPPWKKDWMLRTMRMYCDAYRLSGLAGLNPWTGPRPEMEQILPPVLLTARNIPRNFTGGQTRTFPAVLINDTFQDRPMKVRADLRVHSPGPATPSTTPWIGPNPLSGGERAEFSLPVTAPKVESPTRADLVLEVHSADGEALYERTLEATVFPDAPLLVPPGFRAALYDPLNQAGWLAKVTGIEKIPSLNSRKAATRDLLILAPRAAERISASQAKVLERYVQGGGNVFVMAQRQIRSVSPIPLSLDQTNKATFAFVVAPDHPLLAGLDDAAFRCWGQDNLVVRDGTFPKPDTGNARALLENGARTGLNWTPLFELRMGKGAYLFCQLALAENPNEPTVRKLLQNLIHYAGNTKPLQKTLLVDGHANPTTIAILKGLGVQCKQLPDKTETAQIPSDVVLYIQGNTPLSPERVQRLRQYLEKGATLWIHNLAPQTIESYRPLLGDMNVQPLPNEGSNVGFATVPKHQLIPLGQPALLSGIGQWELTWQIEKTPIAEAVLTNVRVGGGRVLTQPAALAEWSCGKGRLIVDQIAWDQLGNPDSDKARRILLSLLTNLGIAVESKRTYTPATFFQPIAFPVIQNAPNTMKGLPIGRMRLNETPFILRDNGEVSLLGQGALAKLSVPLNQSIAHTIRLLWAVKPGTLKRDTPVATCTAVYENGTEQTLTVRYGEQIGNLYATPKPKAVEDQDKPTACQLAWRDKAGSAGKPAPCLYTFDWPLTGNPKPLREIHFTPIGKAKVVIAGVTLAQPVLRTILPVTEATAVTGNGKKIKTGSTLTLQKGDKATWFLSHIQPGRYYISLFVRTGGQPGSRFGMIDVYDLSVNGTSVPLVDATLPMEYRGGASDGSWALYWGMIRNQNLVTLKPGDRVVLQSKQNWAMAESLTLDLEVRNSESQKRDIAAKTKRPMVQSLLLDYTHEVPTDE